ncbi:MAG: hypothetical protein ABI539_12185 [Acidobacteriota bacterium]
MDKKRMTENKPKEDRTPEKPAAAKIETEKRSTSERHEPAVGRDQPDWKRREWFGMMG